MPEKRTAAEIIAEIIAEIKGLEKDGYGKTTPFCLPFEELTKVKKKGSVL